MNRPATPSGLTDERSASGLVVPRRNEGGARSGLRHHRFARRKRRIVSTRRKRAGPSRWRLPSSIPVESALGRAGFFDSYHFWYKSELDARGSSSPAAKSGARGWSSAAPKSMHKRAFGCDYLIDAPAPQRPSPLDAAANVPPGAARARGRHRSRCAASRRNHDPPAAGRRTASRATARPDRRRPGGPT